jgi:murein DD-endopeptidase MepM/ murein hydrolase activator NlpD
METKLFSPLLSSANNIVKMKRSLPKRARDYNDFINWLDTSNKDIKKIKLPKKKKVEDLQFSVGSALGGGGGGGGLLNLLLGGAAGLGARFLGKGINAVKGFGKSAISKIFPKSAGPATKKAAVPATKKAAVPAADVATDLARKGVASGADDAAKVAAMKGGGKLASKGGELAAKLIPGLATAVNLGISGYRFSQGDVVGGSLSLASAIPILGWAAVGVDVAREFGAFEGTPLGLKKEKPKNKIDERLKAQETKQREAASSSDVAFASITDKFDKVVSKFEKIAGGMGAAISGKQSSDVSAEDKMTEYGEYGDRDQTPSTTPGELQDLESTGGVLPSSSSKGDKFGYSSWRGRNHNGIDYPLPEGTPISVIQPGTVADAGFRDNGYGNQVKVNHPGGVSSFYAHLSSINVASGQKIDPGTVIGKIGSTGHSTGPHLHFEVDVNGKTSNPEPYEDRLFRFGGNVKVKAKKGGNQGAPDPKINTIQRQQSPEEFFKGTEQEDIFKDKEKRAQFFGEERQFKNTTVKTPVTDPEVKQALQMYNAYVRDIRSRRQDQVKAQPGDPIPAQISQSPPTAAQQSAIFLMGDQSQQVASQPQVVPIPIGNGGGGGGVAVIMPSEGQILNSLWTTMLLTNLSSA